MILEVANFRYSDRFGNLIDPEVGYARGKILKSSTEESLRQARAFTLIGDRIEKYGLKKGAFNFTGLRREFLIQPRDLELELGDGFTGRGRFIKELGELVIKHMGGKSGDGFFVFNRTTSGIIATILTLVKEGDSIVSVVPRHRSHPSVRRGTMLARAKFVEVKTSGDLEKVLEKQKNVSLVVITGVTMWMDVFPLKELEKIIQISKKKGVKVFVDDASAYFRIVFDNQPPARKMGADVAIMNTDKGSLFGPRAGIMVGKKDLVQRIGGKASSLGLEAQVPLMLAVLRTLEKCEPGDLQKMKEMGMKLYEEARKLHGDKVTPNYWFVNIDTENILEIALKKSRAERPAIVPVEAGCALGMILLQDHGIIVVSSIGAPGATSALRFRPYHEEVDRFGGAEKAIVALDESLEKLSNIITKPNSTRRILFG